MVVLANSRSPVTLNTQTSVPGYGSCHLIGREGLTGRRRLVSPRRRGAVLRSRALARGTYEP
eukprot:2647158-Pyramimonas_sp.AAC.1